MKHLIFLLLGFLPALTLAQKPRLVVPMGHTEYLTSVAFSPDGKYVLTGSLDQTARLWDLQGKEVQAFQGHLGPVKSVSFSPDGKYVLTLSGEAILWDLSGKKIHTFKGNRGFISASFSRDGKNILTRENDIKAKVWILQVWNLQGQELQNFRGQTRNIKFIDLSPDGKFILTASDNEAKLWNRQGTVLKSFLGHTRAITSMSFSPDGRYILTGSKDKTAKLWNLQGAEIRSFTGHKNYVYSATFSPDGTQVLTGSSDRTAKVWDLQGREIQTLVGHSGAISSAVFSSDGELILTGSYDETAKLWNLKDSGKEIQTFRGYATSISSAVFSPDGAYLLNGSKNSTAKLWDLQETGVQSFEGHKRDILSVAFSPGGEHILTASKDKTTKLWDLSGRELHSLKGHKLEVISLAFSPDGKYILTGSNDKTIKLWNLQGNEIRTFLGHERAIASLAFSPDGKNILSASWDQTAKLWNLQGQQLRSFPGHIRPFEHYTTTVMAASFSQNGQSIITGSIDNTVNVWEMKAWNFQGSELQKRSGKAHKFVWDAALSPDGKSFLGGKLDGTVSLWDINGTEKHVFRGHTHEVISTAFSPDGKFALTGSKDHTMKLWDIQTGKEVATLMNMSEQDWIVTTPSGLFDASPGAMALMHYVFHDGKEAVVIDLDQLKERYYEPGLLTKLIQGENIRTVETFVNPPLYPSAHGAIRGDRLNILLEERGGGIGKVSVFINQKEVIANANTNRETSLSIDLSQFSRFYEPGINKVSFQVYNSGGWLKSQEISQEYRPSTVKQSTAPSLFTISIGTAEYNGDHLDLTFAGKDAVAFSTALQSAGQELFRDRVHSYLFSTEIGENIQTPSKTNIKQAFTSIALEAAPWDIVVVYLSGHGVTYGSAEKANFYYLTQDIASEDLSDIEIRKKYAISDEELTNWLANIPAHKQVMIVDACNSGKIVENLLAGEKKLNSTQIRALDRMKDRTGMFVLAGSAADKVSFEATQYGQGLLTYSILAGMSGRATQDDGRIDVMTLFQFSRDEVPDLAKSIKGIQTPMLIFPKDGSSFDIGIVNEGVHIPISQVKPVFVRNAFQDEEAFDDVLGISESLNRYLMDLTAKGANAKLVFVNASTYSEDSYSIKGRYTQSGDSIQLKARLFKGKTAVTNFEIEGTKQDLDGLSRSIMREVQDHISP